MATLPPPPASPPVKPAAPPPPAKQGGSLPAKLTKEFAVSSGRLAAPQKVLVYGTGGIGKSELCSFAPNPLFLDLEDGTKDLNVNRIGSDVIETFADLRAVMNSDKVDPYATVVIDTATKGEELAVAHTLATVRNEKGHSVDRIEAYGFGKGFQHAYETFLLLLQDGDRLVRRGKNVILIAHDCVANVPNPVGDDFIRYEPHLQSPTSGKASIRHRVVQWADHVLFVGYDVVSDDGKGKGGGTRSIWTTERPDHIAKVRGAAQRQVPDCVPYRMGDGSIWGLILGGVK